MTISVMTKDGVLAVLVTDRVRFVKGKIEAQQDHKVLLSWDQKDIVDLVIIEDSPFRSVLQ